MKKTIKGALATLLLLLALCLAACGSKGNGGAEDALTNVYTVTYLKDGEVYHTQKVREGVAFVPDGIEDPEDKVTEDGVLFFTRWQSGAVTPDYLAGKTLTRDWIFTARYRTETVYYTIVFRDVDGSEVRIAYLAGEPVHPPTPQGKQATDTCEYDFDRWVDEEGRKPSEMAEGNAVYFATYREVPLYTATFLDGETVVSQVKMREKSTPVPPTVASPSPEGVPLREQWVDEVSGALTPQYKLTRDTTFHLRRYCDPTAHSFTCEPTTYHGYYVIPCRYCDTSMGAEGDRIYTPGIEKTLPDEP